MNSGYETYEITRIMYCLKRKKKHFSIDVYVFVYLNLIGVLIIV